MTLSNLTVQRQNVVSKIIHAMSEHARRDKGLAPVAQRFTLESGGETFETHGFGDTAKIIERADDFDSLVIHCDGVAFVYVIWGEGTGNCVNNLSESLCKSRFWRTVQNHIEFMDI